MVYVLPSQSIRDCIRQNILTAEKPIDEQQIQPSSLDLRLGDIAYRVSASFLPGGGQNSIRDKIDDLQMHRLDLTAGAVLEKGCVYIVPLLESCCFPDQVWGKANPKSSTGRLDVFARVISDGGNAFDDIRVGYSGQLYVELSPRTFSVRVRTGDRLCQLRLFQEEAGEIPVPPADLQKLPFTVDVSGESNPFEAAIPGFPPIVGWRARKHAGLIDVSFVNHYNILDYWEPVFARPQGGIILDPDDFYILATQEMLSVPPEYSAEMLAYNTALGEFRVHYAGFFDPGFGMTSQGGQGSRGVLEVRTHEVPFFIDKNQIVGHLVYDSLLAIPDKIYGKEMGSHYQGQGLHLAKFFKKELG